MPSSSLLLDEAPMLILPSLACLIGDRHAIVLQQIHFWIMHYRRKRDPHHLHNGRWWVYNTLDAWHTQFPWWSPSTIRRILESLREDQLLITGHFNQKGYDQTLWYTIDYDRLHDQLANNADQTSQDNDQRPFAHFEQIEMLKQDKPTCPNCTNPDAQTDQIDMLTLDRPIPETTRDQPHETTQTWYLCLQELQMQTTKPTFDTWLQGTELFLQDDHATITCPNAYAVTWLQNRLHTLIQPVLNGVTGRTITITYSQKEQ